MKKVISYTALGLVGLLILATVIMAFITVGTSPQIAKADSIQVYRSSQTLPTTLDSSAATSENYEEFIKVFNGAGKSKALPALFNGTISSQTKMEKISSSKNFDTITKTASSDNVIVVFSYTTAKTAKYEDTTFVYKKAYFVVTNSSARTDVDILLFNEDNRSYYKIVYSGSFYNLFDFAQELPSAA